MNGQLQVETTSRPIPKQGHIAEGVFITMRCSQFEKTMLVICDDCGRVTIHDGDPNHLVERYETKMMAARMAAEHGLVTDFVRYQREAELQRDILTVIHGFNGTLQVNGKQISPNIPFNAQSVLPFVQLWAGMIGPDQYHIVGHNDGEVSWLEYNELGNAKAAFGVSNFHVLEHHVQSHVHEFLVPVPTPTGLIPQRLPIRSYGLTHLRNVYATFRASCDQQNGCWIVAGQPSIQINTPAKISVPAQLAVTPVGDWPFNGVADFVQAAVDAALDVV